MDNGETTEWTLPEPLARITDDIKISIVRDSAREIISQPMDKKAQLYRRRLNNYIGLAELAGFQRSEITYLKNIEKTGESPTQSLLELWEEDENGNRKKAPPTVNTLLSFLQKLGRFDILDECKDILVEDIEVYKENDKISTDELGNSTRLFPDVVPKTEIMYDAYVNSDKEDLDFVKWMAEKLENPPYNLKLFIPERNEVFGCSVYSERARLIETRCMKLIAVISQAFINSDSCEFALRYAVSLSPAAKESRIIPIVIEENVHLPRELNFVANMKLALHGSESAFVCGWSRLANYIKSSTQQIPSRIIQPAMDCGDVSSESEIELPDGCSRTDDSRNECNQIKQLFDEELDDEDEAADDKKTGNIRRHEYSRSDSTCSADSGLSNESNSSSGSGYVIVRPSASQGPFRLARASSVITTPIEEEHNDVDSTTDGHLKVSHTSLDVGRFFLPRNSSSSPVFV